MANKKKDLFMVSMDGGTAPKYIHQSLEEATTEAKRLCGLNGCIGKTVRVLQIVKCYQSKVTVGKVPFRPKDDKICDSIPF